MKTVCFLGDSITQLGYWIAEVFEYLKKDGIRIYNCGVGGDCAAKALSRLYADCLCRTPDTVVIMFGVNDIGIHLYTENPTEAQKTMQAECMSIYQNSIRELTEKIQRSGIDIILCTPTPYNDRTPATVPLSKANDGLAECASFILSLAAELSVPCVDFFNALRPMLGGLFQTMDDRIHPTQEGQHIMAQLFLLQLGFIDDMDLRPFSIPAGSAQKRFDIEHTLSIIRFVEWNSLYSERMKKTLKHEDYISLTKDLLAEAKKSGDKKRIQWYTEYLDTVEKWQELNAELVRLTLEMNSSELS